MLIENLVLSNQDNSLMDAGDLDGQIAQDFQDLADRLRGYREGHLEQHVKGKSAHYEEWDKAAEKKIQYAERVARLARLAKINQAPGAPERLTKDQYCNMPSQLREPTVLAMALREAAAIRPYLPETVYVEKQSFHPDDWYLWSVAACRDEGTRRVWDCWTLNLDTGSMNGGHYGLGYDGLKAALAAKRGISQCQPESCRYAVGHEGQDEEE